MKRKVNIMLDYVLEALASRNHDSYEFIQKWLSNIVKGNKNNSCLSLKSMEGVEKSTLFVFLRNYVMGKSLCLETRSKPIKSTFKYILGGKLIVLLEEVENVSINEWQVVSMRLK